MQENRPVSSSRRHEHGGMYIDMKRKIEPRRVERKIESKSPSSMDVIYMFDHLRFLFKPTLADVLFFHESIPEFRPISNRTINSTLIDCQRSHWIDWLFAFPIVLVDVDRFPIEL